jgi:2-hydroxy-3-oxopropionate reductase
MARKIGFIGLGTMGKPMAKNLLKAGFAVTGYDINKDAVKDVEKAGGRGAVSPKEVAAQSDVIITMLPDSPDVENVYLGLGEVIASAKRGATIIDMSTVTYKTVKKVAAAAEAKGLEMLDAPVSGGEEGAINATLAVMVGGKKTVFEECLDIFRALGKKIVYLGDIGMGQVVKACHQLITATTLCAISEALVLGTKAGADPRLMLDVIKDGAARCWMLENRAPTMIRRDFTTKFKSRFHHKDLGISLDLAKEFNVPLPVTSLVHQLFGALKAKGRGELDHSAIITLFEDMVGIEVKAKE